MRHSGCRELLESRLQRPFRMSAFRLGASAGVQLSWSWGLGSWLKIAAFTQQACADPQILGVCPCFGESCRLGHLQPAASNKRTEPECPSLNSQEAKAEVLCAASLTLSQANQHVMWHKPCSRTFPEDAARCPLYHMQKNSKSSVPQSTFLLYKCQLASSRLLKRVRAVHAKTQDGEPAWAELFKP